MKKRYVLLSVLVLLIAVVLCACGDDKESETSQGHSSSESTPAGSEGVPTMGGSLVFGMTSDLASLDPHQSLDAGTRSVLFNMYDGLVKATSTGELEPAVAEDYEISPDAKTYTFTLRDGVTFHDGSAVTVEDIQYSIERYAELEGEGSAFYMALDRVEIVDDKTIKVHLKEGNSEFLSELTLAILPKDNDDPAGHPIGTGPYQYVSYTVGQRLKLKKYEGYWKENGAYLDTVDFKVIADLNTAILELQAGTIDVLNYLTAAQTQTLGNQFTIVEGSMNLVQAMFLNNDYEPFQDVRVRQAMCYAIDRQEISNFLFGGKSNILGAHMIPAMEQWYEPKAETVYEYNVDKAKQLLAEAGYADGFDLVITVPSSYTQHVNTAEIIVDQLSRVGIHATIRKVEWTTWKEETYRNRQYQATIIGFDGTLAPSDWLKKYETTAANNIANYSNAEFDEILAKALASIDEEEKSTLYKQLQMNLAENAASVFIQDPADFVAMNAKFGGYEFYPTGAWDVSKIYVKAQS